MFCAAAKRAHITIAHAITTVADARDLMALSFIAAPCPREVTRALAQAAVDARPGVSQSAAGCPPAIARQAIPKDRLSANGDPKICRRRRTRTFPKSHEP